MKASELIAKVQKGEIDVVEHTRKVLEECHKINEEYHYFNTISDKLAMELAENVAKNPKGKLAGLPISVKDAICVKDVESRGGSAILKGYKPVFHATLIQKIIDEGGIIIGKTAQDEFGFGGFSTNVGVGMDIPLNPFDKERSCGGSSGGCGGISQKASFPHVSLGESTGGSIANPAAFCHVFGLSPTYGRVSRYGLMDYGNSLDKVGPMGKNIEDIALVQDVISGHDPKESTSLDVPVDDCQSYIDKDIKGMNVGIIDFGISDDIDNTIKNKVLETVKKLNDLGVETKTISLPYSQKFAIPVYFLLATSEASTNLAKYCGMRYGAADELEGGFNEYFAKVRAKNFGDEAKRRIMLGTFARMAGTRDAYYIKAAQIRTKMIEEYKAAFSEFDALLSPVAPFMPPKFDEIKKLTPLQLYMVDNLTVVPNLVGSPHISIPSGLVDGVPTAVMLTADHLQEGKLMQLASHLKWE